MYKNHIKAIEKFVTSIENNPDILAVIVAGSIAQGRAKRNSDIDLYLVLSDKEHNKRSAKKDHLFYTKEFCDYKDGYFDGKCIDYQHLIDAAKMGSEPTRSSFAGAYVAHTKIGNLKKLLKKITTYPEKERKEKLLRFKAQLVAFNSYFIRQAEKRNDPYLLARSAAEIVLYGSRMILAHNRILYHHHKTLMEQLSKARKKPRGIKQMALDLLNSPSSKLSDRFTESILNYTKWPDGPHWVSLYLEDREWNWKSGIAPLEDR